LLEDVILDTMGQAEEQEARIPELDQALKQTREDNTRFETSSQQRLVMLAEELQKTQAALKEFEATLPADIKPEYERLVASRGEDAMSLVQDRTCSACYTSLTPQNYNDLLAGRLVLCKVCGRIVYLGE
jgi:predicted  nucleic acid-binding Zn-ribbon protein